MPTLDHTGKWLHFHAPKTGGLWVQTQLLATGGRSIGERHDKWTRKWRVLAVPGVTNGYGYTTTPTSTAGHQPFGTIRPPWDWYVSYYVWHHTVMSTDALFRQWLHWATVEATGAGGVAGLATYHQFNIYREGMAAYIPTDRLAEGLPLLLGYDLPDLPKANTHEERCGFHVDYRSWYDDEMIDWVAAADHDLIARFGFQPFKRSPGLLYWADGGVVVGTVEVDHDDIRGRE